MSQIRDNEGVCCFKDVTYTSFYYHYIIIIIITSFKFGMDLEV